MMMRRGVKITNVDAKGRVVLLADGAGSRVDVVIEEVLHRLDSACGLEGKGRELLGCDVSWGVREGWVKWRRF